ncbi:glutathione S-transferase family protein [Aliiglaciecola sp. CAU 1673]|uniref:glutathione S-transferase family protein n=1 Tax=Aliiglaciecola sp. CAU 1673 TaxID=3032595 RepID=UPI0023D99F98|nr:glutathione S-transferase family protein [Aliiglaciecola sp. CAU 1673]MDF2176961.1 glutathione S-transferase family protein [Aliiglaciecola sp. CAU 1673]
MYRLHIANKNYSSWSLRPWVLLKVQDIDFEESLHPFSADNRKLFRSFSPTGKVPCLQHEGRAIWDSLAIIEYLAERHQGVWPENIDARAWARSASAEMHSGFTALRNECPMNCALRISKKQLSQPLQSDLARLEELWQEGLTRFGGPYLAGPSFTAVDAFFAPVAIRIQTYGLPLSNSARAYAGRLLQLEAMGNWQAQALAEPWREESHEQESRQSGEVLQDLR